ncbi:MAG: hypothetical protein SCM96_08430 [Acidobacteriota bacterium]|nr:hypothetical protein [Acidobacteriota bacterium]
MLKNITLSAEEVMIEKAREKARREKTTLNAVFRRWLRQYVSGSVKTADYESFMNALTYARPGRKFSRDELNER